MTTMSQPGIVKNMLRTTGIFAGLLTVGSLLIYFGTRNDAVTVARSIKAGVLTADEVNTAFQTVTLGFRYAISWRTTLYSVFL